MIKKDASTNILITYQETIYAKGKILWLNLTVDSTSMDSQIIALICLLVMRTI